MNRINEYRLKEIKFCQSIELNNKLQKEIYGEIKKLENEITNLIIEKKFEESECYSTFKKRQDLKEKLYMFLEKKNIKEEDIIELIFQKKKNHFSNLFFLKLFLIFFYLYTIYNFHEKYK